MTPAEQQIRTTLGIPPGAQYVVFYDQAAHCDWDWTSTFEEYFAEKVDSLLLSALNLLSNNSLNVYSMCEMSYLQKFVSYQESQGNDVVTQIRNFGSKFRIVGGGITSPDNLLTSGEGFIRNYLLGKLWLASTFPELLPLKHAWLPDDFGHDPELPIVLQALGLISTAFERLPGTISGAPLPDRTWALFKEGVDFNWPASDGSTILAHWLPGEAGWPTGGYSLGSGQSVTTQSIAQSLLTFQSNQLTTPTYQNGFSNGYIYIPNDNDFQQPNPDLLTVINQWNSQNYPQTSIWIVQASFDDFITALLASNSAGQQYQFVPVPYWTGYYMSRPALKILHYSATRLLLAAEVFGLLASPGSAFWTNVTQAWNDFAPSTHHDYICGTATDTVYTTEQLTKLTTAQQEAAAAAQQALTALAAAIQPTATNGVVVANPAGVDFTGAVELPTAITGFEGISFNGAVVPIQPTSDGGVIFPASAPTLGYTTGYLTTQSATLPNPATITTPDNGQTYILSNGIITATLSAAANWGIASYQDTQGLSFFSQQNPGNALVFILDYGDIYEFGNEYIALSYQQYSMFEPQPATVVSANVTVLEQGPVRVRLQAVLSYKINGVPLPQSYTLQYDLVAGEPFLRMTTTGAAPSQFSICTSFPLPEPATAINHGTPCHWTSVQPYTNWEPPTFRATHHFVLPQANNATQAAIYHQNVPAWGIDKNGIILGCLLRNTPGGPHGATGSDSSTHTLSYAFRTPTGLGAPQTGQPLTEALRYVMPVSAALLQPADATLPEQGWLASSTNAIILAAKPSDVAQGTMVLRLYHPTNEPQSLTVTLPAAPTAVTPITALEDPITSNAPPVTIESGGFNIKVKTALNTVQVSY